MQKLLIATHNPAKVAELSKGIKHYLNNVEIISLKELHISDEPEEIGKTFIENSRLKAEYYGNLAKLPAIADDGGLTIDALNGEPGIQSKRWLGRDATDQELIDYTLQKMKHIPSNKRTAQFKIALT